MDILWKGLVGGVVTGLIAWLAKKGNILPGILPLFPTFALIALYLIGTKGDRRGFQQARTAGMVFIPAYVVFLAVCYISAQTVDIRAALALGLAGWFVTALATFLGPRLLRELGGQGSLQIWKCCVGMV
jgi:uncharacterized membrane protein (GlpM family)